MPRNITVTFDDGSTHVYQNAPDDVTPDAVTARAQKEFSKTVTALDGGRPASVQPETGMPGPRQPSFLEASLKSVADLPRTMYGLLEVPTAMISGAAGQLVGVPVGVASTFGEGFGTPQAAQRGQQQAAKIASAMTYRPRTEVGQTLVQALGKPFEGMPPYLGGNIGPAAAALGAPALQQATQTAQRLRAPSAAKLAQMTAEDYARGAQIDAAADAQRLGILLRPTDIQPTVGPRIVETVAGRKGADLTVEANKAQVRKVQLADMGMPDTAPLNTADTFNTARKNVAKPYDEIAKLPTMTANENTVNQLQSIRKTQELITTKEYAAAIDDLVDRALVQTQKGMDGATVKDNISTLRADAKKVYDNPNATLAEQHVADARLAIAGALESMIESNIADPKLLARFRDARRKMARIYAYEGATDLNTGLLDVNKLARITAKDSSLTGDIAALGRIAGNFPHAFEAKPRRSWAKGAAVELGRSTPPGALGGLAGFQLTNDYTGAVIGGLAGALGGKVAQRYAANMLASPAYQAALKLRDLRSPQLNPAEINYTSNMLVPYQPEVLGPSGEGTTGRLRIVGYDENDRPIYAPAPQSPSFTMPPQPSFGAAPTPFAQRSLTNEIPRQTYEAQKRAELAQGYREAAERAPTKGGIELIIDEAGNLVPAPTVGAGSVIGAPSSLESAVQKLSGQVVEQPSTTYKTMTISPKTGAQPYTRIIKKEGETTFERGVPRAFDLTAEERIAWNKAKAEIQTLGEGFAKLDDKAIAQKMMDRQWVEGAITKARQQEKAFADIAARAQNERMRQDALAKREQMMDLLETLEAQFAKPRPTSSGGQGPKTRAAKRNALAPDSQNNLAP